MSTLLVGFDSAWTATNRGGLVGVARRDDGTLTDLGPPRIVDYREAEAVILQWQTELAPTATIILLDQPTIVTNAAGQRPVESLVAPAVSRRRGGMQPANTGRQEMFGHEAPVWRFLRRFGGAADPLIQPAETGVFETYPVLAMIALGWTLPDSRATGRLPKYNPSRRKTFSISDWQHVCARASGAFAERGLMRLVEWIDAVAGSPSPRKVEQDGLDACLCLLIALHLVEGTDCLMVGDLRTGYIVVPYDAGLRAELESRSIATDRVPAKWVHVFQLPSNWS